MLPIALTENYRASLETEKRLYENCTDVHELPDIFHYWSNRYVRPKLASLGFSDTPQMFRKYLELQCRTKSKEPLRFVSLGSGNCDLEIRLAAELCADGHRDFIVDCVDLNPAMLARARSKADQAGIGAHLNLITADLNSWSPSFEYHAAMACHSLHHVVNLEGLFDGVKRSLLPHGVFLVSDMIGRNGHQRWPEALDIVQEFWSKLPPSYRFHRILKCYEESFENRDCSVEGFEGVRSQDILPLLIERFHFQMFVGFANVIDPFVDRAFGPNFDAASAWDRNFIDEVHRRDDQELDSGRLKPTHMMAVVGKQTCQRIAFAGHRSPRFCVRERQPIDAAPQPRGAYEWSAWPHSPEKELQIACRRLAEAGDIIRQAVAWAGPLESELSKRTQWALRLEKQLEERTAWACSMEKDMEQLEVVAARLRDELAEKTMWALSLESSRLLLQDRMQRQGAVLKELEADLEARSAWALRLRAELEEQTRRAQNLERELRSYLHNPLRFVRRIGAGIARRLTRILGLRRDHVRPLGLADPQTVNFRSTRNNDPE